MNERDKKLKRELDRRIDVYYTPDEEEAPPKSKKTAAPKAKAKPSRSGLYKDAVLHERDKKLQKELAARAKSASESTTKIDVGSTLTERS